MRYLDDPLEQRARLGRYPDSARPYIALATAFLDGRLSAVEFDITYSSLFKRDGTDWEPSLFAALNDLFLDLDRYEPDAHIRERITDFIDESQLAESARRAIAAVDGVR
jgi:hypothetical protein